MNNQILKINRKTFSNKYLFQTIWWFCLTIALISLVVIIKLNDDFFRILLQWDFFNNSWNFLPPPSADPNLFQTYLYMGILAAVLASIGLIFIQVKIAIQKYIEIKYQVFADLDNNYFIFKNLLFVNIAKSITYIFCFTSALTFILVIIYFLLYSFVNVLITINFKIKNFSGKRLINHWKKQSDKKSLVVILAIEALYFLIKNFLKINSIGIDFDQILKYFIPASSLALIIAVFIQTLIKNDVRQILKNINNIQKTADNFKIFYQLEGKNVLMNYDFVCDLPYVVKKRLKNKNFDREQAMQLLEKIYQLTLTLESKSSDNNKNAMKTNEFNYLIYHIFYEVETEEQIDKIIKNFRTKTI